MKPWHVFASLGAVAAFQLAGSWYVQRPSVILAQIGPAPQPARVEPTIEHLPSGETRLTSGPIPEVPGCHSFDLYGRLFIPDVAAARTCLEGSIRIMGGHYCFKCHARR